MELNDKIDKISESLSVMDGDNKKKIAAMEKRLEGIDTTPIEASVEDLDKKYAELAEHVKQVNSATDDLKDHMKALRPNDGDKDKNYPTLALGHFIMGNIGGNKKSKEWLASHKICDAMVEGITESGGAVVPDIFVPTLIDLLEDYGTARQAFTVVPMASDSQYWPQLTADCTVYKCGEGATITASQPTLNNIRLVAQKMAALTAISSELREDAALSIGDIVGKSMARSMAKAEDQAAWLGDGSATYYNYVGVTGAFSSLSGYTSGTAGLMLASGNLYSEIEEADLANVAAALPEQYEPDAAWYCSKKFAFEVMVRLAQAASGGLMNEFNTLPGLQYLGYPVKYVNVMPKTTANSQIPLFFGDIKAGTFFGDRRTMQIEESKDVYFASDQTAIRMTERFAINVFGEGAASATGAAGPITGLVMAAS